MKIGLLICTYNRLEYLKQCFDSLSKANLSQINHIAIADDCSDDKETINLIDNFAINNNATILWGTENKGIKNSLYNGYEFLFDEMKCNYVVNLDGDAIVKKNFIEVLLTLKERYNEKIVSGFNSNNPTHKIIKKYKDCILKERAGGINWFIDKFEYITIIKQTLLSDSPNWDNEVCEIISNTNFNKGVICSSPSVVQHIGFDTSMGHFGSPDIADDFDIYQCELQTLKRGTIIEIPKDKTIILNQPFGLGDIIFIQNLVYTLKRFNNKVIIPIVPEYLSVAQYLTEVTFINKDLLKIDYDCKEVQEDSSTCIIPLRWSILYFNSPYNDCMSNKYKMLGLDYNDWTDMSFTRMYNKEKELFELLGLKEGDKYNLISTSTGNKGLKPLKINVDNGLKNIEVKKIEGYTLFDWCKVIEQATTIHTIHTSINFIIEKLNTKAEESNELHLYSRDGSIDNFLEFEYLFKKKYRKYIMGGGIWVNYNKKEFNEANRI